MSDLDRLDGENSVLIQIIVPPIPLWAIQDWLLEKEEEEFEEEPSTIREEVWLKEYVFSPVLAIEVWKDLQDDRTFYEAVIFGADDIAIAGKENRLYRKQKHKGAEDYTLTVLGFTTDKNAPMPEDGWGDCSTQHFIPL